MAPASRPRGIACPCGGRVECRRVYRPVAGVVVRYRRCLTCGTRLVTRETVTRTSPPK